MKTCIAIAAQNEAHWLRLHLPLLADLSDVVIVLDGGSADDTTEIAERYGAHVYHRRFDWNFSAHMNALIGICEAEQCEVMLRLDPDEIMFPEHIRNVFALLSTFKVLRLPRLTFDGDRYHYCPVYYPDWQTRAFWLGLGIRYSGRVHETVEESLSAIGLIESGDLNASTKRDILRVPHLPIFHYEGLRTDVARYFKHMNYARLQAGLEPLLEFENAQNHISISRFAIPYTGAQPIDPAVIGARAPFGDDI